MLPVIRLNPENVQGMNKTAKAALKLVFILSVFIYLFIGQKPSAMAPQRSAHREYISSCSEICHLNWVSLKQSQENPHGF